MVGEEILNVVRKLTKAGWSSFDEINEAYEYLMQRAGMGLSRIRDMTSLTFKTGVAEYQLPMDRIRRWEGIAVKQTADKQEWKSLVPIDDEDFDMVVHANRNSDATDKIDTPIYYRYSPGNSLQLEVTPTPDSDYPVRLKYLGTPEPLSIGVTPILPSLYHRQIANLAAGYILQRGKDPVEQAKGAKLESDVQRTIFALLNDVANNRAGVNMPSGRMMRT